MRYAVDATRPWPRAWIIRRDDHFVTSFAERARAIQHAIALVHADHAAGICGELLVDGVKVLTTSRDGRARQTPSTAA